MSNNDILTLQDIEDFFDGWNDLIFDMQLCVDNNNRMRNPVTEYEARALKHGFFEFTRRQFRFTLIVNLCKIFSFNPQQKRGLRSLCNRILNFKVDTTLRNQFKLNQTSLYSTNKIKSRDELTDAANAVILAIDSKTELLERIETLRNKYYAHSDYNPQLPVVTDNELSDMVKLAADLFNQIRGNLLDKHFSFERNMEWHVNYLIKLAAENQEKIQVRIIDPQRLKKEPNKDTSQN